MLPLLIQLFTLLALLLSPPNPHWCSHISGPQSRQTIMYSAQKLSPYPILWVSLKTRSILATLLLIASKAPLHARGRFGQILPANAAAVPTGITTAIYAVKSCMALRTKRRDPDCLRSHCRYGLPHGRALATRLP